MADPDTLFDISRAYLAAEETYYQADKIYRRMLGAARNSAVIDESLAKAKDARTQAKTALETASILLRTVIDETDQPAPL